jgi:hypothetical protein
MKYITDFTRSRKTLIGSSDVPALIQHPERAESVAGYGRTALTVWEEKTGLRERDPVGFPAHMGHVIEPYVLHEHIKRHTTPENADVFLRGYLLTELDKTAGGYPRAHAMQTTDFLHHTEAVTDYCISHADCINEKTKTLIEAKTAGYWSAKRRDDPYRGYEFDLTGHHGIPLANYFQVQHQAAVYQECYGIKIDTAFLSLISDGNYYEWEFRIDTRLQERILELCSYMKKCIDKKIPPKRLAMNTADIKSLYPKLDDDFRIISGRKLKSVLKFAKRRNKADAQIRAWEQKKEDAESALAIMLKDTKKIQGLVDGEIITIAEWQERKGGERLIGLKEIQNDKRLYGYAKKNGLIKESEDTRFVKVKFKED